MYSISFIQCFTNCPKLRNCIPQLPMHAGLLSWIIFPPKRCWITVYDLFYYPFPLFIHFTCTIRVELFLFYFYIFFFHFFVIELWHILMEQKFTLWTRTATFILIDVCCTIVISISIASVINTVPFIDNLSIATYLYLHPSLCPVVS